MYSKLTVFSKRAIYVTALGLAGVIGGVGYKLANTEKRRVERYGCYGKPIKYISKDQKDIADVIGEA